MKKPFFFLLFISLALSAKSQSSTLSSGGEGSGPAGFVSFSIGQIVVETTEDSEGSISPGVQQAYESYIVLVEESIFLNELSIFPNPTTDLLHLEFTQVFVGAVRIYNSNSAVVDEFSCNTRSVLLNSMNWSSGVYYLSLELESKQVSLHKIVKQ